MGDFAIDTQLTPVDGAPGRFTAEVSRDWEIWGPNGGYLFAIAMRAAGAVAAIPRPATMTCHFLRSPRFERVDLTAEVVHAGRRSESLRVGMHQDGKAMIEMWVRTAAPSPGLEHAHVTPPSATDPDDLKPFSAYFETQPQRHPFWGNLDNRVADAERFSDQAQPPTFIEWYRYKGPERFDDPWLDAARMALLIDTISWPTAARPHRDAAFIAPSIECSVAFHALAPDEDWLLLEGVAPIAREGLISTQGRVWSRDRRLLASGGAQLLCAPAPPRN